MTFILTKLEFYCTLFQRRCAGTLFQRRCEAFYHFCNENFNQIVAKMTFIWAKLEFYFQRIPHKSSYIHPEIRGFADFGGFG